MKKLLITLMLYMSVAWGQNDKFSINGLELYSLNSYPIQPPALFIDIDNAIPFIWPITCKAVLVFFATFLAKHHFIADGIAGLFLGFAGYQMRKKYFLRH